MMGQQLVRHNPDLANQLLQNAPPQRGRINLELIPFWFQVFCMVNSLHGDEFIKQKNNPTYVDYKRIFSAAVVYILDPESLEHNTPVRYGVIHKIAETLQKENSAVSRWVREAAVRQKAYEEFKDGLQKTIELLKTKNTQT